MNSLAVCQRQSMFRNCCRRFKATLPLLIFTLVITMTSGRSSGDDPMPSETQGEIPSFYVRAVTGPLAGKSVCYVCRNGDRPCVMVLLRDLAADSTALLKDLDRTVNRHRAQGLRCFAVLLTDSPQRDAARLQTMAFDEKLDIPLTMATNAAVQGSTLEFPRNSALAVVTYADRKIVQRFSYAAGACDEQSRQVILAASQKLLANE